ncbi:MAG: hypothetical protein VR72_16465 [Clostridiaceae bacterium BRH_c20a]|nr:MAG: hypothetical protein VR72_16465 [Clostridiaceae bacterium BRH_c20a]
MRKNDWKITLTYVGAIVGAGFASGQELVRFFAVFQSDGLLGTVVTGLLFAILGALVIGFVNRMDSRNYGQLVAQLFPRKISRLMDLVISFSLWLGLGVMLAGSAALLNTQYNLLPILGFIGTALLVLLSLQFGSKGLLNANTLLIPFLIIFAVGASLAFILAPKECLETSTVFQTLLPNWWTASMLYVGYNMVLGIVVLASVKDNGNKVTPWSGIIGGLILGIMSFVMVKGLQLLPVNLLRTEMPMLILTEKINPIIGSIYGIGLWIALFTTALANAHSLTNRIGSYLHKPYKVILGILLLSTICFIPWSFSTLVGLIYPMEGYLAIPIIIALIAAIIKKSWS